MKARASPSLPVSNKELAEGIRGLVATMPGIDTKRHELKQQLAAKYTRQVDQTQSVGQESEQKAKRATELPPKPPEKDVDR